MQDLPCAAARGTLLCSFHPLFRDGVPLHPLLYTPLEESGNARGLIKAPESGHEEQPYTG